MTPVYNRYISSDDFGFKPSESSDESVHQPYPPHRGRRPMQRREKPDNIRPQRGDGLLKSILGDNIKLPEINSDTVMLLVLVYFLVADPDDRVSDTILIIAALFLLGM